MSENNNAPYITITTFDGKEIVCETREQYLQYLEEDVAKPQEQCLAIAPFKESWGKLLSSRASDRLASVKREISSYVNTVQRVGIISQGKREAFEKELTTLLESDTSVKGLNAFIRYRISEVQTVLDNRVGRIDCYIREAQPCRKQALDDIQKTLDVLPNKQPTTIAEAKAFIKRVTDCVATSKSSVIRLLLTIDLINVENDMDYPDWGTIEKACKLCEYLKERHMNERELLYLQPCCLTRFEYDSTKSNFTKIIWRMYNEAVALINKLDATKRNPAPPYDEDDRRQVECGYIDLFARLLSSWNRVQRGRLILGKNPDKYPLPKCIATAYAALKSSPKVSHIPPTLERLMEELLSQELEPVQPEQEPTPEPARQEQEPTPEPVRQEPISETTSTPEPKEAFTMTTTTYNLNSALILDGLKEGHVEWRHLNDVPMPTKPELALLSTYEDCEGYAKQVTGEYGCQLTQDRLALTIQIASCVLASGLGLPLPELENEADAAASCLKLATLGDKRHGVEGWALARIIKHVNKILNKAYGVEDKPTQSRSNLNETIGRAFTAKITVL